MRIQTDWRSVQAAFSMALNSQIGVARFCFGVSWFFGVAWFLTDGNQGNPLIALIANDAGCVRIEHGLAVRDKQIPLMAVMQFHAGHPAAVGRSEHWRGRDIPAIEIADKTNMRSSRRVTEKVHVMKRAFRGVTA